MANQMDYKEICRLIKKCQSGEGSDREQEIVDDWFLHIKSYQGDFDLSASEMEQDIDDVWSILKNQVPLRKPTRTYWIKRISIAASLVFGLGILAYTVWYKQQVTADIESNNIVHIKDKPLLKQELYSLENAKLDIKPATNKAQLILSTGESLDLNTSRTGATQYDQHVQIAFPSDGELRYQPQQSSEMNGNLAQNTLIVPKGGHYTLTLADGTRVTLNADSKLTFPIHFNGARREVFLEGEGYFEVTKRHVKTQTGLIHQDFVVNTAQSKVRVLGTKFNVKAYPKEQKNKMTLEEGSIELSLNKSSAQKVVLKPGQQAISEDRKLIVEEVSVEHELAWKDGDFVFNGDNIQDIMNQIGRWYDVNIVYLGQVPDGKYISTISRKKTLKQVLEILETTTDLKFLIQNQGKERRIMVVP